jgi:hypothetical protein
MTNLLKNLIYTLIGSFVIYLLLFRRFSIKLPKEIPTDFLFVSSLVLLFILLFIYQIFLVYKHYKENEDTSSFLNKYLIRIKYHYIESLSHIKEIFFNQITNVVIITKIQNYLLILCTYINKTNPLVYFVSFTLFPRILVTIAFFYDIFYNNQFNYFYKSLLLLIIPILYYGIKHILTDFCQSYLTSIFKFIIVTQKTENTFSLQFTPEYQHLNNKDNSWKLSYYFRRYQVLTSFDTYLTSTNICIKEKTDIVLWVNLIIRFIYLIGWSYILYVSFHTLPVDSFIDLFFLDNIEPFSDLNIYPNVQAVSDSIEEICKKREYG